MSAAEAAPGPASADAAVRASARAAAPRVVTLTPSPVVDRTYVVDHVTLETVHRVSSTREELGGNGVNVARALVQHELRATALVPASEGSLEGMREPWAEIVPIANPVRVNTIVVESTTGATTNFNERPRPLAADEWRDVVEATARALSAGLGDSIDSAASAAAAGPAGWLVVAGSLPHVRETGEPVPIGPLVRAARDAGARIAVDVPAEHLVHVLDPDEPVDLVKPNLSELERALDARIETWGELVAAAERLRERGARTVLVSLGALGVLAAGEHGVRLARTNPVTVRNTTGAGDACLAGYVCADAEGHDQARAVRRAAAWGARAVQSPGTVGLSRVELGGEYAEALAFPLPPADRPLHERNES